MSDHSEATYKGWKIDVQNKSVRCSNFCFDITSPKGQSHHVEMAGDTEQRALERAKEMIDLEQAVDDYQDES
ncbi:hypothetical protein [Desulfogranum japonicum]|uniref:hypothetical protein n=1 Tax=Desulfogranum japonicum TaxID=231447 RepID=UPI0004022D7E|nr:hypothetical protein [Desulfogranum japonicum]